MYALSRTIAAIAILGSISMTSGTASAASPGDAFNRAKLGATWITTAGTQAIASDQFTGSTSSLGYLTSAGTSNSASAVVFLADDNLAYGAVAVGNIGGNNNAFVKIQAQNGVGTFDHGGFYTGNNGEGSFFTLNSPVPSPAILDVSFCGTTATMRITSAAGVQIYAYNYGTTYGTGGGLGTYGNVGLDNFVGYRGNCKTLASETPSKVTLITRSNDVDRSLHH